MCFISGRCEECYCFPQPVNTGFFVFKSTVKRENNSFRSPYLFSHASSTYLCYHCVPPACTYTGTIIYIYIYIHTHTHILAQMVKNPPAMWETVGSVPGLRRSPGGPYGNPLQYSCLENPHRQRSLVDYSPWGCRVDHD